MNHTSTRLAMALGFIAILSGCASTTASVRLDGTLSIIGPRHDFASRGFSRDWSIIGDLGTVQPVVRNDENGLFLEVPGGPNRFAALRPLDAQLLATPFLTWRWRLSPTPSQPSPVQLTIGFLDGNASRSSFSFQSMAGNDVPKFSRALTIAWGTSALQRGSLEVRPGAGSKKPVAKYYVRGGRENLGQWWSETIDLSALHSKAWPDVDMRKTRIAFAGLIMMAGTTQSHVHLAGYRLSR